MSKANRSVKFSGNFPGNQQEDKRVRRTKRLLKEALMELIMEKGYDDVSVQDIIDRADVGRTSFYSYYRSKEDLLLKSLDDLGDLLETGLSIPGDPVASESASIKESPEQSLLFIPGFFQHLEENLPLARSLLGNGGVHTVREHVRRQFLNYFQKGFKGSGWNGRPQFHRDGAAIFASGALISLTLWWLEQKKPVAPDIMAELTLDFLRQGLGMFNADPGF